MIEQAIRIGLRRPVRILGIMLIAWMFGFAAHAADLDLQSGKRPAQIAPALPRNDTPVLLIPPDKGQPEDKQLDGLTMPPQGVPGSSESWWQTVVRSAPGCVEFIDGCRTCTASGSGFVCSNLPIACQPKEWSCSKQK